MLYQISKKIIVALLCFLGYFLFASLAQAQTQTNVPLNVITPLGVSEAANLYSVTGIVSIDPNFTAAPTAALRYAVVMREPGQTFYNMIGSPQLIGGTGTITVNTPGVFTNLFDTEIEVVVFDEASYVQGTGSPTNNQSNFQHYGITSNGIVSVSPTSTSTNTNQGNNSGSLVDFQPPGPGEPNLDLLPDLTTGDLIMNIAGEVDLDTVPLGALTDIIIRTHVTDTQLTGAFNGPYTGPTDSAINPSTGDFFLGNVPGNFLEDTDYYVAILIDSSNPANPINGAQVIKSIWWNSQTNSSTSGITATQVTAGSTGELDTSISNPLQSDINILDFLGKLFANFLKIVIPFLVLFLVYSGFRFVEARGNEEKLKVARKNFSNVVTGALIVLAAWTIATVLKGTINDFAFVQTVALLL